MKKLENLTLKELGNELLLMNSNESNILRGGGIGDNDCVVEALASYGQCSENEIWLEFANMYGMEAMNHAMMEGMSPGQADSLTSHILDSFSISSSNQLDSALESGKSAIGTIATSSGTYHAIIVLGCSSNGEYLVYDADQNSYYWVTNSQLNYSFFRVVN